MPEEKKDSFTFSDKIKSSKPAASKSFGNRISSKIGSNGKPKKTLFERTKRDAPFFIAAIVALLLLPFLYKYSGQVHEEPIATPGSEESIFDPERYGFDTSTTDPDGQIAQLAGRDPLSLIKGWGTPEAEQGAYEADSPLHDGVSDNYVPPTSESNTNIYKSDAAPATRAAFRRSATKIKELGGAGMTTRGGGSLAVGPWGGGLKKAASQVGGPSGPRQGPKPVSLQPLQAAGKASRSSFGQGAAAEARRSKDALSKGNAMQALMDGQMRPVEPGKIGGLTGTDYRGGGNGDLKHAFAYNGIKPWWWDLMAQKHMHDWMWKRNLWQKPITAIVEALGKGFADFFTGLIGCLFTGEDDFSMGSMWGTSEGSGSPQGCKVAGGDPVDYKTYCTPERVNNDPFGLCAGDKNTFKNVCKNMAQKGERKWEWVDAKGGGGNLNALQKRLYCMGATVKGKGGPAYRGVEEKYGCGNLATSGRYQASFDTNRSGSMDKWSVFHYVVGVLEAEIDSYYKANDTQRQNMLTVFYMDEGPSFSLASAPYIKQSQKYVPIFVEAIALKKAVKSTSQKADVADADDIDAAQRLVFLSKKNGTNKAKTKNVAGEVGFPMSYSAFKSTFASGANFLALSKEVKGDKTANKPGKAGGEGKDWAIGARCDMPLATVQCEDNALSTDGFPYATVQAANSVNVMDKTKRRFGVYFAVEKGQQYGKNNLDVKEISLFTPKKYGQVFASGGADVGTDRVIPFEDEDRKGILAGKFYDVVAKNGITPRTPVSIRWSVRQEEGIQEGVNDRGTLVDDKGAPQGTALPGREVSSKICTYYNEGSLKDGVEPLPPAKPVKESDDDGNPVNSGEELDASEVGKTSFAVQITDVPAKPEDRTARTKNASIQFSGTKLIDKCNDAPAEFGRFQVDSAQAQEFVLNIQALYNKAVKVKGLPEISYKKEKPSLANFIDAANMAQSMGYKGQIAKSAVCKFGQAVGALSEDRSVTGASCYSENGTKTKCNNLFGSYASYIGEDSSFFPARLMHTGNAGAMPECNPRFNAVNEVNGYAGQKCLKTTDYKYQYGKYNDKGDRSAFVKYIGSKRSGQYPLAPLVDGITFKRDAKTGDPAVDSKNRAAYWGAYGQVLVGECGQLKGDMPVANLVEYIKAVCTAGLSDKPDHGWDGKNPRYRADRVAVKGGVTNPPPVLTEEEQE